MALTILIVRNQNTTEIESYCCSIVATLLVTHVVQCLWSLVYLILQVTMCMLVKLQ